MNGELRSLYIDSNFAKKDVSHRCQYDLVGGVAVPENSRVYVDNISFTNTFSEKVDEKSNELYVKTRTHNNLRDPSDVLFNWTYNGVLNDHLLAGTYAIKQHYFFADLSTIATTWATQAGAAVTITRVGGLDVYDYQSPTGTEKLFVKIVHPPTFAVDAVLNGQPTTGSYYNGTLTIGNYVLVAANPANVIRTSSAVEPVRDMTGTWTFHDGNQVLVQSTIAQNEFTYTSQGLFGVAKLQNSTAHGTREVKLWRQSPPDSLAHPSEFLGEMDLTTGVIQIGRAHV